jgi:UDP-N-acetylglucosamine--N-acetylmuramyl-(pentapeptide) pyrophosphoryl-undecaprenol N-acetylglucosamine transferase
MAEQGAAVHCPQAGLTPQALADILSGLDRARLLAMAERARRLARPHAAARVADAIERLVHRP